MLRVENLSLRYDDHPVFQGLTHTFQPGCVALCEESSTGKSSLLAIIAGVLAPTTGDVWIDEHSLSQAPQPFKAHVAYVPEDCLLFPMQTGRGLLEQVATEKQVALNDDILGFAYELGLEPHLDKRFEQMSTGTRRKVFLTAAALGNPKVIVADGPSNGLDAGACTVLAKYFQTWAQDRVVLFATHDHELVQACGANLFRIAE